MDLSQNRLTLATLVVVLGISVALVAIGFTVNVAPVYAGTCGDQYVYHWGVCNRTWSYTVADVCGPGAWAIEVLKYDIDQMANPWTLKVQNQWTEYMCYWPSFNCPGTCNAW
jgi:hypothetical protein